jgi:hypothetical protein
VSKGNISWHVGQTAIINRTRIVTVERVTPSGRVIAAGRTFGSDGMERTGGEYRSRANLEPLTPEIQAEMELADRGRKASGDAHAALQSAEKWLCRALSSWGGGVPEAENVEKAERLAAAIGQIMDAEAVPPVLP